VAILYYAKVNINSHIHEIRNKRGSIEGVLKHIYKNLNDKTEYVKEEINRFRNDSDEIEIIEKAETYNFSKLEFVNEGNSYYISGELVRRYPIKAEEFDEKTRKSRPVVYNNHSVSTFFLFDLKSEIVVFFERNKLGYKQFIEGFKGLLEEHIPDIGFEIFLETDKFTIRERIKMIHKVHKIKSIIIPPNANEEALEELYDKEAEQMAEGNIHRRTTLFESHKRNEKGLDIHSKVVSSELDISEAYISKGYGKLKVEGENKDGMEVHYNSDEDSPFHTTITESQKKDRNAFKEAALKGIIIFIGKVTVDQVKKQGNSKTDGTIQGNN
jgi:hypothetical protein